MNLFRIASIEPARNVRPAEKCKRPKVKILIVPTATRDQYSEIALDRGRVRFYYVAAFFK